MTEELKGCPFCKGKGIEKHSNDYEMWWIQCINHGDECGGKSQLCHSAEQAAEAWNTRAATQQSKPDVVTVDDVLSLNELEASHFQWGTYEINYIGEALHYLKNRYPNGIVWAKEDEKHDPHK